MKEFFENIKLRHGDGFYLTKQRSSSVSGKKNSEEEEVKPRPNGATKHVQRKGLATKTCPSRKVSSQQYNRLKTLDNFNFHKDFAVKLKGRKVKEGINENTVKVKNYKGLCLTAEEIAKLKKLKGDQLNAQLKKYQKYKAEQTQTIRCRSIKVSQTKYNQLKTAYPDKFNNKIKVIGKELNIKTAKYKGICVTYDERIRLMDPTISKKEKEQILENAQRRSSSSSSSSARQQQKSLSSSSSAARQQQKSSSSSARQQQSPCPRRRRQDNNKSPCPRRRRRQDRKIGP